MENWKKFASYFEEVDLKWMSKSWKVKFEKQKVLCLGLTYLCDCVTETHWMQAGILTIAEQEHISLANESLC